GGGPVHLNRTLTRAKLEQLVEDLIERTVEPCRQAMADAELKTTDIDEVILVGGQTRMPAVREQVKGIFGKLLLTEVNPEEAVGLGAGIQAGVLVGDIKNVLLIDVTPLTLSVETKGGVATPLIRRNTTIPVRKSHVFTTAKDDQTSVEIVVVQGERVMAVENTVLGRFVLNGIPPAPRGEPRIEVTFKIDADGILQVRAQDQATGKEQQITITASSGLSEEEIQRMVAEAKEQDERNRQRRQQIKTLNRADRMAYQAEKTLERYGDDRLTPALQSKVRSEVAVLRQALRIGEIEAVERAMRELDETTRMIAREFSVKRET
ncbi:MAG: Hsp70 family protein, partial [Dehalococcoidia bacterium]